MATPLLASGSFRTDATTDGGGSPPFDVLEYHRSLMAQVGPADDAEWAALAHAMADHPGQYLAYRPTAGEALDILIVRPSFAAVLAHVNGLPEVVREAAAIAYCPPLCDAQVAATGGVAPVGRLHRPGSG